MVIDGEEGISGLWLVDDGELRSQYVWGNVYVLSLVCRWWTLKAISVLRKDDNSLALFCLWSVSPR